ncbi:MAG: tryptophan--tRNA ligase, partial [Sporomusa sp.]
ARVMSLQEPDKKMSKSDDNVNAFISLTDTPDVIAAKIRRAVTDSDGEVRYDLEQKPGVSNLIGIYAAATSTDIPSATKTLSSGGYKRLKEGVTESILSVLSPLQERYAQLMADRKYLQEVMENGAQNAYKTSVRTLRKVYKKVGVYR